jgi:hypothetical protein
MATVKNKSEAKLFLIAMIGIFFGMVINTLGPIFLWRFIMTDIVFPQIGYLIIVLSVTYSVYHWLRGYELRFNKLELGSFQKEIDQALQRVYDEPEKAKPAWDLARAKLEQYFDRNLSQINYIFWLSVIVMVVGFGFILFGISQTLTPITRDISNNTMLYTAQNNNFTSALVGSIAGIITEFIGATFLFIYRSTIQQALTYTKTLERINSVGMAMQILDTISNESKDLQDSTKAEIVKMVLSQASGLHQESSKTEK